jgi:hypothetical protein
LQHSRDEKNAQHPLFPPYSFHVQDTRGGQRFVKPHPQGQGARGSARLSGGIHEKQRHRHNFA